MPLSKTYKHSKLSLSSPAAACLHCTVSDCDRETQEMVKTGAYFQLKEVLTLSLDQLQKCMQTINHTVRHGCEYGHNIHSEEEIINQCTAMEP